MQTDPNPDLTPRSKYLNRDLTAWSYSALTDLFEGNEEFALFMQEADHQAVFFHEHGKCWLYCRPPTGGFDQAAPQVVDDWMGSTAPKEPGAEPVLMHRDELPKSVRAIIEHVQTVEPEHVHEKWEQWDL